MLLKSRVFVFVAAVYFMTSGTTGTDPEGFERSNYYTNDCSHVDIQNQPKSSAKRQEKKAEHVHNNRAKYHEPKRFNANSGNCPEDDRKLAQPECDSRESRTNVEKRSQHRAPSRQNIKQNSHFHVPGGRVRYHDGNMGNGQRSNAQRLVRKSFNDQGNWRWGFRRKQSKADHSLKETGYLQANVNAYKTKDSVNSHNAREAMEGNSRFNEDETPRQNLQSEPKFFSTKDAENHHSLYVLKPGTDDHEYRAMAPQWGSKEADYQLDTQRFESKGRSRWVSEGSRTYYTPKTESKDTRFSYQNPRQEFQNEPNARPDFKEDYNHEPVETKVMNKQNENVPIQTQATKNQIPSQMGDVQNGYDTRNFGQISSPKGDEQRVDQMKVRYENPLRPSVNRDIVQVDSRLDQAPGRVQASPPRLDYQNQNSWEDSQRGRAQMNLPVSKHGPDNVHSAQDRRSRTEEIRYLVLSPAEFSPETLRRTLGEPEKPRGIPYCTLEEYKMESANLKAKSYDALYERDMRYNGKGSINELISRLKRNYKTQRKSRIKSRASGEGPEMPVHACTASPSTREHLVGMVTQTQALDAVPEPTMLCWAESLMKPTLSAEDMGINFRITPSYMYDHLRGRLPIISQFDYTAGTSCSTPCAEQSTCGQCKNKNIERRKSNHNKRNIRLPFKSRRTPDEAELSNIIRRLESSTNTLNPMKMLPKAVAEEEIIIEKYLNDLMQDQVNQPKNRLQNPPVRTGWLEKLLKDLAENKMKTKMHNQRHAHPKLSLST